MNKLIRAIVLFTLVAPATRAAERREVPDELARCAAFYAAAFGVQAALVDAVIEVESGWNPDAVSSKGAAGLMQLMPATARRFGVHNRFDIEDNIRGGVAYLAWLIHLFRGDLRLVLAAYYTGESVILLRGLAYSSPEVFGYVNRVARAYRALRSEEDRNRLPLNWLPAAGGEP
ncbi:MAG: lytic transglycosylase domain-containing protein [Candidatus Acidiferrales bacterium]